jgi:hypothetical protein
MSENSKKPDDAAPEKSMRQMPEEAGIKPREPREAFTFILPVGKVQTNKPTKD